MAAPVFATVTCTVQYRGLHGEAPGPRLQSEADFELMWLKCNKIQQCSNRVQLSVSVVLGMESGAAGGGYI